MEPVWSITQAPVLRDQVYEIIEDLIISGRLAPGERLVEADLARQLDVSRSPVREALPLLAKAGWLDVQPRHGTRVHVPEQKEIEDFFGARRMLEAEAARLATLRCTADELLELERINARGVEALKHDDGIAVANANSDFHAAISRMADNQVLEELQRSMAKRLRWYFRQVARDRGASSWDEHLAMIEAMRQGKSAQVAVLMSEHVERTAEMWRQQFDAGTGHSS